jgi:hypothetical protein
LLCICLEEASVTVVTNIMAAPGGKFFIEDKLNDKAKHHESYAQLWATKWKKPVCSKHGSGVSCHWKVGYRQQPRESHREQLHDEDASKINISILSL